MTSPTDKCETWFLVFSGKLHDAIMSGQMKVMDENVLWRTTFFENVFLDVDNNNDVFGNCLEFVAQQVQWQVA